MLEDVTEDFIKSVDTQSPGVLLLDQSSHTVGTYIMPCNHRHLKVPATPYCQLTVVIPIPWFLVVWEGKLR